MAIRADEAFPRVEGGFSFENFKRNEFVLGDDSSAGIRAKVPGAFKTGTTIVGLCTRDAVVLGADTRATGNLIVDKNCEKIHYVSLWRGKGRPAEDHAQQGFGGGNVRSLLTFRM